MGQVGDRLKRAPQAARWSSLQERADDCVEAVAITVDRMPQRHEPSRFGEEQKKNAIEHRQRMLEEHTGWKRQARTRDQRRHDSLQRLQHTVAQRPANLHAMTRGQCDRAIKKRDAGRECLSAYETPQRGLGEMVLSQHKQVEFHVCLLYTSDAADERSS